ncbi:16630_t:CDS:2 [Funneliformis geosporum]|nr:16630_t:CDS:2 [Funneliformis geosporum]
MSEIQNNELNNRSCQFRAQENSITDENDKNGNEAERMKIIQRDIEKGVITVSNVNEKDDLDVEISKLDKIPRFEPLIKPHAETGFTLSGLWGSAPASSDHVKEQICEDQRIVMETVKSVDTYCVEINQTMIAAQLQAKTNYEQMGIVNVFMKQVEKTHKMVHEIFQTLNKIENLLPAEERLTDQSASIKHPTLHKLWLNTRQKHNHGSFQFETRRLSLQKRRTHFSVVTVSFDTVLSDKHQDSDIALSPVRSPDGTILSNVQSVLGSSEDSSASDRLKEIFSNQSQSSEDISSSQWLSAMRESVKKANTSIENLQGLQEVHAATNNYGSPNSSPSLLSSNSSQYHKSPINNVNKPSSPGSSISLLTAMLRRTTVKEGETKNKVTPKIRKKKSISSSIHNHNSTVSKTSIEEITISNDHGRKNDLKDLTHPKQVSKEGLIIQFESEDSRSSSEERNDNMEDSEI